MQVNALSGSEPRYKLLRASRRATGNLIIFKAAHRFDFNQYDFTSGQYQLKVGCIASQPGTIGIFDRYGLFSIPNDLRRSLKKIDCIEFQQSLVMNHSAVLTAGKLATHDPAGRSYNLSRTAVLIACWRPAQPRPLPKLGSHYVVRPE